MIQDIYPHIYHNEYKPMKPEGCDIFLFFGNGSIVVKSEKTPVDLDDICYFTLNDITALMPELKDYIFNNAIYLFSIDQEKFFMFLTPTDRGHMPNHKDLTELLCSACGTQKPLAFLRTAAPTYLAFAGITGHQLFQWYESRRFCGKCGHELVHSENERMMYCESCHTMEYPVLCPAVIVAVTDGDRLLLTKYEGRAFKRYALVAGYAEIGETIEETVHREVMEEVGLCVKNLRYYKSQPWSFSGTLLFGFFCELDGTDTITLDREELSVAQWFDRRDIPEDGENTSLTREMMMAFKNGIF